MIAVTTTHPTTASKGVQLRAKNHLSGAWSARIIKDSLNITVHLPIYYHHTGAMANIDMIMHYPTLSLKLLSTTLYNGKSFDVAGSAWEGRAKLYFAAVDLNGGRGGRHHDHRRRTELLRGKGDGLAVIT